MKTTTKQPNNQTTEQPNNRTTKLTAVKTSTKQMLLGLIPALAMMCFQHDAMADLATVDLGTAGNFAVLAGSGITVAGAVNTTTINGNIGTYPTPAVTGLGNVVLNGVDQTLNSSLMSIAKYDLSAAFTDAAGRPATTTYAPATDLGGLTLTPGVYFFASSAQLTGTLTLNDEGNPDAVFVFQIGSTLTTASDSSVVSINDGGSTTPGISTFWQVGSSATLGTTTAFEGNILALTSITADTGATDLDGRLLARNGAVTLDDNTITAPPAEVTSSAPDTGSTLLLLGSGLAALFAFGRRFSPLPDNPE